MKRALPAVLLLLAGCAHGPVYKPVETRTYHYLPTGNGHGFQVFDEATHRLVAFLDHPYRYLRAPKVFCHDGPERRNLIEGFSLGVLRDGQTAWLEEWAGQDAAYRRQSNVIETSAHVTDMIVKEYYFSPFGLERNALVALAKVESMGKKKKGAPEGLARLRLRLGDNPVSDGIGTATIKIVDLPGARLQKLGGEPPAWVQTGRGQGAVVFLPVTGLAGLRCEAKGAESTAPEARLAGTTECAGAKVDATLRLPAEGGWFGVAAVYVDDPAEAGKALADLRRWLGGRAPEALLEDTIAEFEAWRKPPQARFRDDDEAKLWRQSEAVLRMSQVREQNFRAPGRLRVNHGMILASLAPGNWTTGWVRDGAYATVALARMGHFEEARKSLDFFLNAEPVGALKKDVNGSDYRISVTRYYGTGEEEADCSGQPGPNMEMDGWGLVLWTARQYLDASGDDAWLKAETRKGTVYEALRDGIARPIEENIEPPPMPRIMRKDSSIWESNHVRKHYSFTTVAAIRGLCDFAAIAARFGRKEEAQKYARLAEEVREGFLKAYVDPQLGVIGSLDRQRRHDLDGATIESITLGALEDAGGPVARRTLQHLEELKLPQGGYKRNGGTDAYEINEWVFVDLRLASAFYRAGRFAEADALVRRNVRRASANFFLLPEEYNDIPKDGPVGMYTGAIPMVGYGSGVFALTMLDREGLLEPRACAAD